MAIAASNQHALCRLSRITCEGHNARTSRHLHSSLWPLFLFTTITLLTSAIAGYNFLAPVPTDCAEVSLKPLHSLLESCLPYLDSYLWLGFLQYTSIIGLRFIIWPWVLCNVDSCAAEGFRLSMRAALVSAILAGPVIALAVPIQITDFYFSGIVGLGELSRPEECTYVQYHIRRIQGSIFLHAVPVGLAFLGVALALLIARKTEIDGTLEKKREKAESVEVDGKTALLTEGKFGYGGA